MPDAVMELLPGYLAIGVVVGFFAGMLGIGGGAIIVPLLVLLFESQGISRTHILHLAVGSGMATVLFTSLSSVRAHALRGAIRWDVALKMTPGILAGGVVGAALAAYIPTKVFAVIFAGFIYVAAANMLVERKPKAARALPGWLGMFAVGFAISALSAFVAIGGAFMTIPFMLWCGVPLLSAIGTAAMIGFPIALSGSVGFALSGWQLPGLPSHSLGFIYLPAVGGIVLASVLLAPLGAAAGHRMPTRWLRRTFALLFFVLATRMALSLW